jgi:hypothetical protein
LYTLSFIGLFTFGIFAVGQYIWSTSFLVKVVEEKFGRDTEELENILGALVWVLWSAFLMGILYYLSFDLGMLTEDKDGYLHLANGRLFILYCEGFIALVAGLQLVIFKPWWLRLSKRYEAGAVTIVRR